jgi:cryptochrome
VHHPGPRYRFLLESLRDLDTSLRAKRSRLYVVRGKPAEVFPTLFAKWSVTLLTFETGRRVRRSDGLARPAGH